MKDILGTLYHLLYYADHVQQMWFLGICCIMVLLAVLHHVWKKDDKRMKVWRFLCAAPLLVCVVHFFIYCSGMVKLVSLWGSAYIPMYVVGVLPLLGILFAKRKLGYRIYAVLTGIVTCMIGLLGYLAVSPLGNYSRLGYTDSFCAMADEMQEHYVLADWKGLDFDQIKQEYLPEIEEAERNQDAQAFAAAVKRYIVQVSDGHVGMATFQPEFQLAPVYHDYGLGTVMLDSGELIAVRTSKEANAAGIYDGAVITKWNDVPVEEVLEQMEKPFAISAESNVRFLKAIYLSATGGESVSVAYLDDSGEEKTTELNKISDDADTVRSVYYAFRAMDREREENFSTKMLTDSCGYLRLSAESTENPAADLAAYLSGVHKPAMRMFKDKLDGLSGQGMEKLVIDLRGNGGGMDEIALALTSLFADQEYFGIGLAVGRDGDYRCVSARNVIPEGFYKDLPVVVLTDFRCASAGDGAALYLSRLPNVTLAGITDPNGCNQEVGGMCILSGAGIIVTYPTGLVVDENNDPNIDTSADGISRNPVEVRIPLDAAAVEQILAGDGDYELEWAVEYLESAEIIN